MVLVGQQYGVVSYDLNAVKPAMQIQVTESLRYDDIFIMPGAFHFEMAYFKAIGKFVEESGRPEMLTDFGVLAPGSLNGFLSGKHFNRCKCLHPMFALAFEILHSRSFLATIQQNSELDINEHVHVLQNIPSKTENGTLEKVNTNGVFSSFAEQYRVYTTKTRSGAHGATARYWMIYNLERAIRTNDINLFCHAITPVINILIATNHINYSRWRTQFQLDLLNIDNTHPGLRAILEGRAFSVRRTNKPFSRAPLDLTLEQTVNCDAASRLTRLSSATNNYSARLRWMSSRAAVISMAQEMTGLTSIDGTTAELHPSRIESDLQKVLVQIQDSYDPFQNTSEKLFNISSGKAASQPVQSCLLGNAEKGNERHKYFM